MGVYIKGMQMPLNCSECPMCYDMMECTVAEPIINFFKEELKKFDFCTERHPRCPLVSVPPHGRLGDLDALYAQCDDPYRCVWRSEIEDAPTIIEAEEE